MKGLKLKKSTQVGLMTLGIVGFMVTAVILEVNIFNKDLSNQDKDNNTYINNTVFDNQLPVVKEEKINDNTVVKPYTSDKVKVLRNFYNYEESEDNQKESIYYYGYTYIQNEGIDYSSDDTFDVVSVLDGKVLEITNDEIFGNTIKIDHGNDVVSVYQSLSEITVKTNSTINKGDIIGKSGNCSIDTEGISHLHFELIIDDVNVNPDLYYNKELSN